MHISRPSSARQKIAPDEFTMQAPRVTPGADSDVLLFELRELGDPRGARPGVVRQDEIRTALLEDVVAKKRWVVVKLRDVGVCKAAEIHHAKTGDGRSSDIGIE